MQAREFESVIRNHSAAVPEHIPDGTHVKITVLTNEGTHSQRQDNQFKALLCEVAQGLDDADLARSTEKGRDVFEWPTS
jgi:hypothetical protein